MTHIRMPLVYSLILTLLLVSSLIFGLTSQAVAETSNKHPYAKSVDSDVEAALKPGAGKEKLFFAEAGLAALGWFVLYGNDEASMELELQLSKIASNSYVTFSGAQAEKEDYRRRTNLISGFRSSLKGYGATLPVSPSFEYEELTTRRIVQALAGGPGSRQESLAEASLVALGWMTLYGNGAKSMASAHTMMRNALALWPGNNGIYRHRSINAYAEMINLGRFAVK